MALAKLIHYGIKECIIWNRDKDALQRGWVIDPASQMLIVTKQCIVKEQKLDPSKLQRLTAYVFHLEH
ncbi:hypothetical protein Gogos_010632 [Gossypium gossypioides]|uniref:Uncharacterized protein n=1 Tax=Gossypium gossypioides TaxID=34282 RepID=A0A7J9BLU6_GOSGO|nr:hypothetical protein [Gossypium gossypioides]